jgi:UrcA family protein
MWSIIWTVFGPPAEPDSNRHHASFTASLTRVSRRPSTLPPYRIEPILKELEIMKRIFNLVRASIPVSIALACFAVQPAAHAELVARKTKLVASEHVMYSDLDLSRAGDAQILLGRIKEAAFRVCGGDPREHVAYDLMPARIELAFRECRAAAVERAIATVDMPQLTTAAVH